MRVGRAVVCLPVCLPVCLSVCLPVCLSACLVGVAGMQVDTLWVNAHVRCSVYLLRGLKLKGLDDTGMSDPYVKLKLGKVSIDDRKK